MLYLNWRGAKYRETLDELNPKDFPDRKALRTEKNRLVDEYAMSGMSGAYWSSRPCNGWNA